MLIIHIIVGIGAGTAGEKEPLVMDGAPAGRLMDDVAVRTIEAARVRLSG